MQTQAGADHRRRSRRWSSRSRSRRRSRESVKQEEGVIHEQTARLTELVEQGRNLAAETAERLKQVQTVSDDLDRAAKIKEELLTELARVQARQRDAVTQTEAAEDQLKRAETMVKQLEQRRTQLAFSEKKIATFEGRLSDLTRATESVEQKIKSIAEREALVQAVKAEVESVHKISSPQQGGSAVRHRSPLRR